LRLKNTIFDAENRFFGKISAKPALAPFLWDDKQLKSALILPIIVIEHASYRRFYRIAPWATESGGLRFL
jgi:hypothetical protein